MLSHCINPLLWLCRQQSTAQTLGTYKTRIGLDLNAQFKGHESKQLIQMIKRNKKQATYYMN